MLVDRANVRETDLQSMLSYRGQETNSFAVDRIAKALSVEVEWLSGLSDAPGAPASMFRDLIDEGHRTAAAQIVKASELLAATREALAARRTEGACTPLENIGRVDIAFDQLPDGSGSMIATPRSNREEMLDAAADWRNQTEPSRIAAPRQAAGLTRRQLGDAVGCGKDTIRRLEEGGRTARLGLYVRLAEALGVGSIVGLGVVPRIVNEAGRPHPVDVEEIVERFGGVATLAAAIGVTVDEAARWAREGVVPVVKWLDVLNASDRLDLGLSSNGMIGLHQDAVTFGWLDQRWPGPAADAA